MAIARCVQERAKHTATFTVTAIAGTIVGWVAYPVLVHAVTIRTANLICSGTAEKNTRIITIRVIGTTLAVTAIIGIVVVSVTFPSLREKWLNENAHSNV